MSWPGRGRAALNAALVILVALTAPEMTRAQLVATFKTTQLSYDGNSGNCDFTFSGLPTCELYFRFGIFDQGSNSGSTELVPGTPTSCSYHELETGTWNYPDAEISRQIPDMSTSAQFYFALFDEDPSDADDLLGTHAFSRSFIDSGNSVNNEAVPVGYSPRSCDDGTLDDNGATSRFGFSWSVWFSDTSAPVAPDSAPVHADASAPPGLDDDAQLNFNWPKGSDPHSGVSATAWELREDGIFVGSGSYSFDASSLVICDGCGIDRPVADGSTYALRVRVRNGDTVQLQNPQWSPWTSWSDPVLVDLSPPVTEITSPAAETWQNADFMVSISDSDPNLASCDYRVNGSAWQPRTCNSAVTITVGGDVADDCSTEGLHVFEVCVIEARSEDTLGVQTVTDPARYSIDHTADGLTDFTVKTDSAGIVIPDGSWTMDRDPEFSWALAAPPVSPITGYSFDVDADPDCETLELAQTSYAVPADALADGITEFRVRAVDEAGNCGPVGSTTVQVDGAADAIVGLAALTEQNGEPISEGIPQEDNTPWMAWDHEASVSPVNGYSLATGGDPDCTIETSDSFTPLGPLQEGTTTFWVRAIDEAGNCGASASFEIVVVLPDEIYRDSFEKPAGAD